MKYILIGLLFITTSCFAVDTNVKVQLTKNQIGHLSDIKGVKSVSYWPKTGDLVIVSENELSEVDKTKIVNDAKNLPDTETPKVKSIEERISALEKK